MTRAPAHGESPAARIRFLLPLGSTEQRALAAVRDATHLACLVRDEGPQEVEAFVRDHPDPLALTVALASLVPVDQPARPLLAWLRWDAPTGADRSWSTAPLRRLHATFVRLRKAGQPIPVVVADGEREYQRRRHLARTGRWAA